MEGLAEVWGRIYQFGVEVKATRSDDGTASTPHAKTPTAARDERSSSNSQPLVHPPQESIWPLAFPSHLNQETNREDRTPLDSAPLRPVRVSASRVRNAATASSAAPPAAAPAAAIDRRPPAGSGSLLVLVLLHASLPSRRVRGWDSID